MHINDKIELTRDDFEISIAYIINQNELYEYERIYDRHGNGQYVAGWMASLWIGWCEAIKAHAVLLQPLFDEQVKPACEKCGYKKIMDISSTQERMCHKCHNVTPWLLKDNQAPSISSSRDKRKSKS